MVKGGIETPNTRIQSILLRVAERKARHSSTGSAAHSLLSSQDKDSPRQDKGSKRK